MEHQQVKREVARRNALIYLPASLGAALLFFQAANLGDYTGVARLGGIVWVGLLSLIVSMPVVTDWVNRPVSDRS